MNHIYKTIWNRVRRCYVAVNEKVQSSAQTSGKSLCAIIAGGLVAQSTWGASLIWEDGFLTTGALDGYSEIKIIHRATGFNIGSINSPNASVWVGSNSKKPGVPDDAPGSMDNIYYSNGTVNGNIVVRDIHLTMGRGEFKGNVTLQGKTSDSVVDRYITLCIEDRDQAAIDEAYRALRKEAGVAEFGSAFETGGITVDGDVRASYFKIMLGVNSGATVQPIGGYTHIKGSLYADNVFLDNPAVYDDISDRLEVDKQIQVTRDIYNNGFIKTPKLVVGRHFKNGTGKYSGELEGDALKLTGADIGYLDALSITNGSLLNVGTLANTRGQTYTQTYGTIKVTNNWFTDSTINLSGGVIDEQFLGQAHNLGMGNHYNVSGGTLKVGDLRGDSTIVLSDKGTIETKIDSVFENIDGIANPNGLNTIGLTASVPEEVRNTITEIFKKYVSGDVIQNVLDRVTLQGGKILISGVNLTTTQRDDLTKAFKERFFHNCGVI
ncbi:MAG: ESPR domain-containing protein [Sutterella wadsworthensis]|nr:ESPR domain-containing protein [Sutterella wadsworthensis]